MRPLRVALLFALFVPIAALAKSKSKITIEVVSTKIYQSGYTYATPGIGGSSHTNCNTNGTTNGTINDYGVGPIHTHSSGNADTNCTTTTTGATPPQTHLASVALAGITAIIIPDGTRVALSCEYGVHRCAGLTPGRYAAEIDGKSLLVYVPELSGKVIKVKYKAVIIERGTAVQSEPTSIPGATRPSSHPFANSNSNESNQGIAALKEKAASGDVYAETNLGLDYEHGDGVSKDDLQATVWFRKAAGQGFAYAQALLGIMYELGQGVPRDAAQAAIWYRKSGEQGNALAQWSLGTLYEYGRGVPQDYAEAYFWLDLGAVGKIDGVKPEDVAKERDAAASHLTPADLSRVQERARKWFEDHAANSK